MFISAVKKLLKLLSFSKDYSSKRLAELLLLKVSNGLSAFCDYKLANT